jgi:hypothetical protein
MSVDKAKEAAANAAVDEHINNVGRKLDFLLIKIILEGSHYRCRFRFNNCSSSKKNWYAVIFLI